MSGLPALHAGVATTTHTTYPPLLVAKIYDLVFFDDDETEWDDPFVLCEVKAYRRLGPLQGTEVPRFYGYFAAALPGQDGLRHSPRESSGQGPARHCSPRCYRESMRQA